MEAPSDVHSLPVAGSPLSHEHVCAMPGAARCKAHTATSTTSRRAIAVGAPPPPLQLIQQRETSPKGDHVVLYHMVRNGTLDYRVSDLCDESAVLSAKCETVILYLASHNEFTTNI